MSTPTSTPAADEALPQAARQGDEASPRRSLRHVLNAIHEAGTE